MGLYHQHICENSCDAVLWNKNGKELLVSFYDRIDDNNLKGSVEIYDFLVDNYHTKSNGRELLKLKCVFDHKENAILHICHINDRLVALADTSGSISLLYIEDDSEKQNSNIIYTNYNLSARSMCLYMDYNASNKNLWYSCQNGHVGVTEYDGATGFYEIKTYSNGHKYEAWYVCCFNENMALSGGDDGNVCLWDSRINHVANKIDKYFDSGVTSILSMVQYNSYMFMVGSFDESITIWDMRKLNKEPVNKFTHLGGQLWRMSWEPNLKSTPKRLACAMMQSKSSVFEFNSSYTELNPIYKSSSNALLVYGIAWHPTIDNLLVSCSHKDKLLELFEIDYITV